MKTKYLLAAAALTAPLAAVGIAHAAPAPKFGDPVKVSDDVTIDPILDGRLRWEDVRQPTKNLSADAVTMRLRAGAEVKVAPAHLALLVEGVGTLGIDNDYNAFPYAQAASSQYRPQYAVVADPQNVALNRLQLQYKTKNVALTVGRQRINLDDQRWVGSVGWRQNEQTFDAVRGEVKVGPLHVDATYADSQRTVFGAADGGPRAAYDGRFVFLGAGIQSKMLAVKGFAYLLDYDPTAFSFQTNSSQTYGLRAVGKFPLSKQVMLSLSGSYADQSDYGSTPFHFHADYVAAEGGLSAYGFTASAGYEKMGSDGGLHALQTPMATLHKFDGWADVFLTTPSRGLKDTYGGLAYAFPKKLGIPGLNAQVTYHQFDSDFGNVDYGHEWDAAVGWKTGPLTWLAKYADYKAVGAAALGSGVNTRKFWLQTEFSF